MKLVEISPGMKEVLESMNRVMGIEPPRVMEKLFSIADKTGKEPCGKCHLQTGETCNICNAHQPHPPEAEIVTTPKGDTP